MYCMQFVMYVSVVYMVSWCSDVVYLGAMYISLLLVPLMKQKLFTFRIIEPFTV